MSSAIQSPLKLSIILLVLFTAVTFPLPESLAFQQQILPCFRGARSTCLQRRCCPLSSCLASLVATSDLTRIRQRDTNHYSKSFYEDEKEELLIEEENPQANFERKSKSGVRYGAVFDSIHVLYPPTDLEKRNAASRSDGYWPFINNGQEPPKQYTYGEFDLYFFAELLDRALDYHTECHSWNDKVFTDVGSGSGRLVFAAAALHPSWRLCRGVEVLESIHNVAVETLEKCRHTLDTSGISSDEMSGTKNSSRKREENDEDTTTWKAFGTSFSVLQQEDDWLDQLKLEYDDLAPPENLEGYDDSVENMSHLSENDDQDEGRMDETKENESHSYDFYVLPSASDNQGVSDDDAEMLSLAPIEFTCGSFEDPYEYIGDSDLIFVFSSCMSSEMMSSLSEAVGRQCKPGTIIITTDYSLPLSGEIDPLEDDTSMPFGSYELELLESVDGYCWLTGGHSTAYIHRVVSSLWEEGVGRRTKPAIPVEEQAYRVALAYESGELTDTNKFLREVRNAMIFNGFPESWLPSIDY